MNKKFFLSLFLLGSIIPAAKAEVAGGDLGQPYPSSFYMGVLLPRNGYGGGYDGNHIYGNGFVPTEAVVVPKIDPAFGVGVSAGIRQTLSNSNLAIGIEGSFERTHNDAKWGGSVPFNVTADVLNVDFKLYGHPKEKLQPYGQLGINRPMVTIKNGYANIFREEKDATYYGLGFNAGIGFVYFYGPQLAFNIAAIYRQSDFDKLAYADKAVKLSDKFNSSYLDWEFGMAFHFKVGR